MGGDRKGLVRSLLIHHQESLHRESSWEAKERPSTQNLEKFHRSRDQVHGQELVSAREECTGQEAELNPVP